MVKIVQNSFLGGQLDWEMMGRQDFEKYSKGACLLQNFVPQLRGGIAKRTGTDLRHCSKDIGAWVRSDSNRLIPFSFLEGEGWCIVVQGGGMLAFNRNVVIPVERVGAASFYGESKVWDVDYCQCGDVVFLAHPDYPPQCIKHYYNSSSGTHSFRLEKVDFNRQSLGVPSISGATVVKTGITTKGATVTEHYRVTSVFDGVETFPSRDYADMNCADYDTGYDAWQEYLAKCEKMDKVCSREYQPARKSYSGTSYTAPWTSSQKISLKINVNGRTNDAGETEYPSEVRVYRKTGTYYGLVGRVDLSSYIEKTPFSLTYSTLKETIVSVDNGRRVETEGDEITRFGTGRIGRKVDGGISISLGRPVKRCRVLLSLGSITYDKKYTSRETDAGETEYELSDVTFTYRPSGASVLMASAGAARSRVDGIVSGPENTKTVTVAEDPNLENTWQYHMSEFAESIADTDHVVFELESGTEFSSVMISVPYEYPYTASEEFVTSGVAVTSGADTPATVTFDDNFITPDVSLTPPSSRIVMNAAGDYPSCVTLSQQRLIWASTRNDPSRVFMSQVGDFYTYAPHDVQLPDDAIDFIISMTSLQGLKYLLELKKIIGFSSNSEWVIDSASSASGMTYETIRATQHSRIGTRRRVKPVVCEDCVLFVDRAGRSVRKYSYKIDDDGYGGTDVSVLSTSVFAGREIVSWAYQQYPNRTCWCVLNDGTLASITFDKDQNVTSWATHTLGEHIFVRDIASTGAVVAGSKDLAGHGTYIPTSQIFLLATCSGHFEILEMRVGVDHNPDVGRDSILCVDSLKPVSGEDYRESVTYFDGVGGMLPRYTSSARYSGYLIDSVFRSPYPVVADAVGMAQMDVKYVHGVSLRTSYRSGGTVKAVGVPDAEASVLPNELDRGGGDATLGVGLGADERVLLMANNCRDGRIEISHRTQYPFEIILLETDLEVEEGGKGDRR